MFSLADLRARVVQAPMAGGPSTVDLAVAVAEAGALGSLAAGYLSPAALNEQIQAVKARTSAPFQVNVFCPEAHRSDPAAIAAYADALSVEYAAAGLGGPEPADFTDDSYPQKLEVLRADPAPLVSFTFGLPSAADVESLHTVGSAAAATVTSAEEAHAAIVLPIDALVVQGPEAGGHRAQHDQAVLPDSTPINELVHAVRAITSLPIIAAGGIGTPANAQQVLDSGADAVQLGTRFLTTSESGTKPVHRAALLAGDRETVVTRVYSGRPARGLRNGLIDRLGAAEVVGYPEVNTMTGPLRKAAPEDSEIVNMWAGTGYRACAEQSAAELIGEFSELHS